MKYLITVLFLFCLYVRGNAQDSLWTLDRCIEYARAHNITIQQSAINERLSQLQWEESRLAQLPDISFSIGYGRSFGRSINPTTNLFESNSYDYTGLNGSASVLLFGWFQKRNTIKKNDLLHQAASADLDQLRNDVSLNVATGFLRILMAKEQIDICAQQLRLSKDRAQQTQLLLQAGRSNGLDAAEIKTQLITDSTIYFKALLEYHQAIIDLKAILNLTLTEPFLPVSIPMGELPLEILSSQTPDEVFEAARIRMGSMRSSQLKIESAQRDIAIAKGALYPQLNLSVSSGTNYSSTYYEYLPNGDQILMPWGKQIQNNLAQSVALNISIPVFNGLASRYAIKQAKLSLQSAKWAGVQAESDLRQGVYKAWNDVQTALQTYYAAKSAAETAETGYYFAQQRYDKGLINALDLLTAQNTQFKARSDEASAKYDLIFKLRVIAYYLGKK